MKLGKPLAVGFAEEREETTETAEAAQTVEAVVTPVPEEAVPAGR